MDRFGWRFLGLLALASAGLAGAQPPPPAQPIQACATLEECMAQIRDPRRRIMQVNDPMDERIVDFGEAAVAALVPLLMDADLELRERAGFLLAGFRRIDPRHRPALVEAWRRGDTINRPGHGNGWLPRAIAATGTDEALRLLWQDYLREPDYNSNSQVFFALADMGDRIRPLVLDRFRSCRESADGAECAGLYHLLRELAPPFPPWSVEAIVDLAGQARSDEVREGAEAQLLALRHPAGLAPSQRRLVALAPETAAANDGVWQARRLIGAIARYGEAASASGPVVARYLGAGFDEDLRADAALALGRIGDGMAAPALLALAPQLQDDWLLAYNVAESLGRLRADGARPLLQDLARNHWHAGVRNNAARALNALAGGAFARPDVGGDGAPYAPPRDENGDQLLYFGDLRFAGDDASRWCSLTDDERSQTLRRDPVGAVRWPRRGAQSIELAGVSAGVEREVRRRLPDEARGRVTAILPTRSGELVGFHAGEFGGGLVHLPDRGGPRWLIREPVAFAWRMGGRLHVAAGLAHLLLDEGHLYVVDPDRLRVERIIRLPASPRRAAVSSRGAVIVKTAAGHLAVREDGQLVAPESVDDCGGQ